MLNTMIILVMQFIAGASFRKTLYLYSDNSRIFLTSVSLLHVAGKVVPGKRRVWKAPENSQAVASVMSGRVNNQCCINKRIMSSVLLWNWLMLLIRRMTERTTWRRALSCWRSMLWRFRCIRHRKTTRNSKPCMSSHYTLNQPSHIHSSWESSEVMDTF